MERDGDGVAWQTSYRGVEGRWVDVSIEPGDKATKAWDKWAVELFNEALTDINGLSGRGLCLPGSIERVNGCLHHLLQQRRGQ